MSWFELLSSGKACKSTLVASTAISGGSGSPTVWGKYTVINYSGTEGVAAEAYADAPPSYSITGNVGASGANAYLLPWGANKICYTKIAQAHSLFLTHAMNGCGVIIGGDRANPTIVHANAYDTENLDNLEGEAKAQKRCEIYATFIDYLQTQGVLGDGEVATWYPGADYKGAKSGVYGVRKSATWIFYGHANLGSKAVTKVIWPADATPETKNRGCKCCFITTAVCESLGLPDDCEELTALRWFRDAVMAQTPQGRREIEIYYDVAPAIVEAIDRRADAPARYLQLYADSIRPAVDAIQQGQHQRAYALYRQMMEGLAGLK